MCDHVVTPEVDATALRAALPQPQRGLAILAVLASMSLVVLDAGMANVALPNMAQSLGASPARVVLVITAYQTALVMALLPAAALGDRFGNREIFGGGVAIFLFGSLLCAVSPSLPWLVLARFIQGLGGAAVMALGVALLRFTVAPTSLGVAVGWNALTVALSSAAAPTLGALIISRLEWSWLFLANLPIGVVALTAAQALPRIAASQGRLELTSISLNAAAFALLVLGAEVLTSSTLMGGALIGGAIASMTVLVRRERPKAKPLIPLDLLRNRSFGLSVIASILCFTGQSAGMIALPFYLHRELDLTPLMIGVYMSPWPLSVAVTSIVAGRLADRFSTAWLCVIGGGFLATGLLASALWQSQNDPHPLIAFTAVCGLGFGLFQVPNNRNMFMSAPPDRSGAAGGMQGTARLTGQTVGAVLMTLLFTLVPLANAPRIGLAIGGALAAAAGLVSALRAPPIERARDDRT